MEEHILLGIAPTITNLCVRRTFQSIWQTFLAKHSLGSGLIRWAAPYSRTACREGGHEISWGVAAHASVPHEST